MDTQFGLALDRLCTDRKWSGMMLASRAGINQSNVSRLKTGDLVRGEEAAKALIHAFPDKKERVQLVHAYVRDLLTRLEIAPSEAAVPLEPSGDSLANMADPELYDLFVRLAKEINAGNANLRQFLKMSVQQLRLVDTDADRRERRMQAVEVLKKKQKATPSRPGRRPRAGNQGT